MLKLMSGGLLKPTRHRVLNNSGQRTRTSCAFFYEPVSFPSALWSRIRSAPHSVCGTSAMLSVELEI